MSKQLSKNIKVGILLIVGTIFLFAALYLIGSNQNLFGSNFLISARFKDVSGLMQGNNVRFAGIDVGTVKTINIINDSTVEVEMTINKESQKFIRKNALAVIGTDGLMGNKLINILNGNQPAPLVEDGDVLLTTRSSELETLINNLGRTSEDISKIVSQVKLIITDSAFLTLPQAVEDISAAAESLKSITNKTDNSTALWSILGDKQMAEDIKISVQNIKRTSDQAALLTADLRNIMQDLESGKGTIGMLMTDSMMAVNIKQSTRNIKVLTDSLIVLSSELNTITHQLNTGKGAVSTLVTDTIFGNQLKQTMTHIKNSSASLEESMEALKHNFLFKRYFKKKEAEKNN